MTAWRHGVCETDGVSLHYLRTGGAGPPVVMLHGLMGSGACWAPLARALERDFDVVMPDARGHGDSSAPPDGYRYEQLARDVETLVRDLRLERPVLLGHSMGGMTAAVVASRGVGLRGVILVDPTFLRPERQREVSESDVAAQHREALALTKAELVARARARHPQRSPELVELQAEARLKTRLAAFDVLTPPSPAYRELVRAIDCPALLVIGDAPVVTLAMATELRELQPRLRLAQIEGAGHGLPFEQPDRLREVVVAFLRELA
jgi:N-formylmaleamate deformylase